MLSCSSNVYPGVLLALLAIGLVSVVKSSVTVSSYLSSDDLSQMKYIFTAASPYKDAISAYWSLRGLALTNNLPKDTKVRYTWTSNHVNILSYIFEIYLSFAHFEMATEICLLSAGNLWWSESTECWQCRVTVLPDWSSQTSEMYDNQDSSAGGGPQDCCCCQEDQFNLLCLYGNEKLEDCWWVYIDL